MTTTEVLRFGTWNLGHQAGYNGGWRSAAHDVAAVVNELNLDVVVFTEFVPTVRPDLPEMLDAVGLRFALRPADAGRANYTLVASRLELEMGVEKSPTFDVDSMTNVLHVRIPEYDLDVFGIRVPAYKASLDVQRVWDWLGDVRTRYGSGRAVLLGDLNVAPEQRRGCRAARDGLAAFTTDWQRLVPSEGASYFAKRNGQVFPWAIDHIFATRALMPGPAVFVCRTRGWQLVNDGPSHERTGFLSDHAALVGQIGM